MEPLDGRDEVVPDGGQDDIILALLVGKKPGDLAVLGGKAFNSQQFNELLPEFPVHAPQQVCENRLLLFLRHECGHDVLRGEVAKIHKDTSFGHVRVLRVNLAVGVE